LREKKQNTMPNKALHLTGIPLRSIAAGELERWEQRRGADWGLAVAFGGGQAREGRPSRWSTSRMKFESFAGKMTMGVV
jgi:hypothetical protein